MVSDFGTCNRGSVPDFRQLSPSPSGATNFIHLFCYTTLRSKNITNFDKINELLKSSMEKKQLLLTVASNFKISRNFFASGISCKTWVGLVDLVDLQVLLQIGI